MSAGICCPKCDGPAEVRDSRPRETGGIRRRRFCPGCGARFTTFEVMAGESFSLHGDDLVPAEVAKQQLEMARLIARLEREDRIVLIGLAKRLVGGPRLELFARSERPGWSAWGNEVGARDGRLFAGEAA